ncbi:MAG: hypothetical protein IJD48_01135 [Clostridia bacterium]|nr:hypothetical protein [Clostridia bacterium]
MDKKYELPNHQATLVENQSVFSSIAISRDSSRGSYPSNIDDGVVFISSETRLMAKDGSNNILEAIGISDYEGKVDLGGNKMFIPTTFEELVTAFRYTSAKGLEDYFRRKDEVNTNLNALLYSFIKNNLFAENIDVKELVSASYAIKDIVDAKAQRFYEEKEDFYTKKIQRYQNKIESLRHEQSGVDEFGLQLSDPEQEATEIVTGFIEGLDEEHQDSSDVKVGVNEFLAYFNRNKKAEEDGPSLSVGVGTQSSITEQNEEQ